MMIHPRHSRSFFFCHETPKARLLMKCAVSCLFFLCLGVHHRALKATNDAFTEPMDDPTAAPPSAAQGNDNSNTNKST